MNSPNARDQEVENELAEMRAEFVGTLWKGILWIALVAIPISVWRAALTGWLPLYTLHVLLAVLAATLALARHRLPRRGQGIVMVALLWLIGIPGLFVYGLAAPSILWLVLSCLVASTLYSTRAGLAAGVVTLLTLLSAGLYFMLGHADPQLDMNAYLAAPSGWAMLLVVTGTFVLTTLSAFGAFTRSTIRLLHQVKTQGDQIAFLSLHDPLTGLPQLRLARDRLGLAMADAHRRGSGLAVLCIDLDRFKAVNDEHGHAAGDEVLATLARRMRAILRAGDTLARVGGDEFLAILPGPIRREDAALVAGKLVSACSEPVSRGDDRLQVGASVGIALAPEDGNQMESLLERADAAMYAAKHGGRSGWAFATEATPSAEAPNATAPLG